MATTKEDGKSSAADAVGLNELLYGYFILTEKDQKLYELAKQYHEETEAYDRIICSRINERGVAIPINDYEYRLVNHNALDVFKRLLDENRGITQNELRMAINKYID